MGIEQKGTYSAGVIGRGRWFRFHGAIGVAVGRSGRMVPPPSLGVASGDDNHCHQHSGRSHQCRQRRVAEGGGGSGNRRPAAVLHNEERSAELLQEQLIAVRSQTTSFFSSTNFLSLSSDPASSNEFVTAAVPFSTLVIT